MVVAATVAALVVAVAVQAVAAATVAALVVAVAALAVAAVVVTAVAVAATKLIPAFARVMPGKQKKGPSGPFLLWKLLSSTGF